MTSALIFLILLGCDDAVTSCDVLEMRPQTYVTRVECQDAAEALLEHSMDKPYPSLVTQCGTAEETVGFIETVAPAEQLAAAIKVFRASSGN